MCESNSRSPGFLATVASRELLPAKLDASVGASGPHDFAVHAIAARLATLPRPPHHAQRS